MAESNLSPQQVELVTEFLTTVNLERARNSQPSLKLRDAIRFLIPREFNLDRAIKSCQDFEKLKASIKLPLDPMPTFKFTGSVDEDSCPILLLEATAQDVKGVDKEKILSSVLQTLECVPLDVESCEREIVIIVNIEGFFQHPALMKNLLGALMDVFPVLVKSLFMIHNPKLEEVYHKFVATFLTPSSRSKVSLVTVADLHKHIPTNSLPESLGGTHSGTQLEWMDMCLGPLPTSSTVGSDNLALMKKFGYETGGESFEDFLSTRGLGVPETHKSIFPLATLPKSKGAGQRNGVVNELKGMFEHNPHTLYSDPRQGTRKYSEQVTSMSFSSNGDSVLGGVEEKAPTLPPKLRKGSAPARGTPPPSTTSSDSLTAYLDILSSLPDLPPSDQSLINLSSNATTTGEGEEEEEVKPALPPKQSRVKVAVKNYLASTLPRKKERQREMDRGDRSMTLGEIESYISDKGKRGLALEYLTLREEQHLGTFEKFKNPINTMKNRYRDVGCVDQTRVQLQLLEGVEGSDYIHANFVDGYSKQRAFICTQGPLQSTVSDFWRMVMEQQCYVIVMITRCIELGRIKCAQYWPEREGSTKQYGEIDVELMKEVDHGIYILRMFSLRQEDKEHVVTHFQFTAWPDYGVPLAGREVIQLIAVVRAQQKDATQHIIISGGSDDQCPPILVHCSAGIGRSGTYCTLDHCMDQIKETGKANIMGTVRKLRSQRACSIQTEDQYEFCYKTILEYGKNLYSDLLI